jgi:hypothetical protein
MVYDSLLLQFVGLWSGDESIQFYVCVYMYSTREEEKSPSVYGLGLYPVRYRALYRARYRVARKLLMKLAT